MKKIIALTLAILLLFPLTCSCHSKKETADFIVSENFDTSKNYEITFWAKNDTNINQVNIYKKAIEDFQKIYPNITVTLKLYTDYGKIYNDVITNISTNTTPNVCISYPDHIATYLTGENIVVPLDELFDNEKYGLGGSEVLFDSPKKEELVPEFLNECIVSGRYYAVPYMRSTEALYINKDFVEKLGYTIPEVLTWDFIWEVSRAAAKKDESGKYIVNNQTVMLPFIYKSTDNMMIQMLKQKGFSYSDASGNISIFNENTKGLLFEIAENVEAGAFETFKRIGYPADYLNAGQCIFAIDSTAGATWMGSNAPLNTIDATKTVPFETVVRPIPQYDTQNLKMISQGPSICIFNKEDSSEVLASWLFTQFMLTNEVQIAYSQTEGYVPVTKKALQSDEYKDYLSRKGEDNQLYYDVKINAAELLIENTENCFVTPVFNGSASLRNAAGYLVEETVKSVKRSQNVNNEYTDKLFESAESLYRLDEISSSQGKKEFEKLPLFSKILLFSIAFAWICIFVYLISDKIKSKKNKAKE